jgi:hypothetical protein
MVNQLARIPKARRKLCHCPECNCRRNNNVRFSGRCGECGTWRTLRSDGNMQTHSVDGERSGICIGAGIRMDGLRTFVRHVPDRIARLCKLCRDEQHWVSYQRNDYQ